MLSALRSAPAVEGCPWGALRRREFARLDTQGLTYLDHAASALYGASQVEAQAARLREGVFGNPHSTHAASRAGEALLDAARTATLRFLDADPAEYDVVLTANASAAIKLVGEAWPFSAGRGLTLSADDHNSVTGLREFARAAGAPVTVMPLTPQLEPDDPLGRVEAAAREHGPGLLAFPFRSNFSGVEHPLELVGHARALGFEVLLDAAGLGAAGGLSLRAHPADFVALSFYKLFGLPTGLGALVARREALARLRRPWFAGGTVAYVSVEHERRRLLPGHAGFEDGTPDFLSAGPAVDGFAFLDAIDRPALRTRLRRMTSDLRSRLAGLRRADGGPAVRLYGPEAGGGPVIAFNLLAADGRTRPYAPVEARAAELGLALRGGCFCNPGTAEAAFGLAGVDMPGAFDRLGDRFTLDRLQAELPGATIGALRLSLGLPTVEADLDRAAEVIARIAGEAE